MDNNYFSTNSLSTVVFGLLLSGVLLVGGFALSETKHEIDSLKQQVVIGEKRANTAEELLNDSENRANTAETYVKSLEEKLAKMTEENEQKGNNLANCQNLPNRITANELAMPYSFAQPPDISPVVYAILIFDAIGIAFIISKLRQK